MMKNAQPSKDPSNDGTLLGAMNTALNKFLQGLDDMLPAKVVAFDRATNRATVEPLILIIATNGDTAPRAQLSSVPVYQIGGGGCVLNFNLKPGDLGWIKANDRDISLFLQSYKTNKPNTFRKHNFSDAVFFPDAMKGMIIAGEDAENAVLQTLDGSVRISIWPDKVKITAPTVEMETENLIVSGDITATGDVFAGGISLMTHVHTGGNDGNDTGAPV